MRISSLAVCCALALELGGCGGLGGSAVPSQGAPQYGTPSTAGAPQSLSSSTLGSPQSVSSSTFGSPQAGTPAGPRVLRSVSSAALAASQSISSSAIAGAQPLGTLDANLPSGIDASGSYDSLVLSANPIAYYQLGDSGTTLADRGRNRLNGVYGGTVRHDGAVVTSSGNHSAIFPGSPPGSNVPANTATVTANALFAGASRGVTIEAWVRANDWNRTGNFQPLVSYGRDAEGEPWIIELTPQSSVQFFFKTNGGAGHYLLKPAAAKIVPGLVYQVVATYDGANAKVYVNGTLDGSLPASGTLNYGGVHAQYGLSIGGALGGIRPIFNGAIGNVSIYPGALSAGDVENHFVRGQLALQVTEKPVSSDGFVDTIGVNTHISGSTTLYNNPWSTFAGLIKAVGIRHIRDALAATPTWYPQHIAELRAAGIHASLVSSKTQSASDIVSTLSHFSGAVEAVEGLNEPDDDGLPASQWIPQTRNFQAMLWSAVKGHPATSNLHVVGPSTVWQSDAIALGNLSAYMDRGDVHDYFGGFNPGTIGWGPLNAYGVYGSISYNVNVSKVIGGANPVWATETGYKDVGTNSVDERTLARYVPRVFLENFLHGIDHSSIYDFYDDNDNTPSSNFGLVRANKQPKSSYYALKSLIAALADPGAAFAPSPLSYVLDGNTSNVHHLLLQKRDGTYELVIWVETPSFDPNTHTDLAVPLQTVTLAPSRRPSSGTLTTIGDSGNATARSVAFPNGTASFAIDDHVSILSFK